MARRRVKCPCGCGRKFVPTTYNRKYYARDCTDRMSQRALRERRLLLMQAAS